LWSPTPPSDRSSITALRFVSDRPLDAGRSLEYRIDFTPSDSMPGDRLVNYAWARDSGTTLRMVNAAAETRFEEPSALQIHKGRGVYDERTETISWTITVRNSGDSVATGVVVTDTLGEGLSGIGWSQLDVGSANGDQWLIGRLTPGQTVTALVTARVDLATVRDARVENFVSVESPMNPLPDDANVCNETVEQDTDQFDCDEVELPERLYTGPELPMTGGFASPPRLPVTGVQNHAPLASTLLGLGVVLYVWSRHGHTAGRVEGPGGRRGRHAA
jgi:uncharacterized repeat protein (TIGR01451 family)